MNTIVKQNKLLWLAAFCLFPLVCFANPLRVMPTPYGGVVYKYKDTADITFLLMVAFGLGVEYILVRLLTRRLKIKPLPWFLAFVGVHVVSWPLATIVFSALENSTLVEHLTETAGLWITLPLVVGFEVLVGIAEGTAFGMIFSSAGQLRDWIIASIVGNIIGFMAGFTTTLVIAQYIR